MASDTRQRIMETARRLFNEQRFGNVTTAALAAEVGIAEGNLWYHFKNKRMLLEALNEEFIAQTEKRMAILPTNKGSVLGEFAFLLLECAHELREFRFLYRDQADYGEHTDVLLQRLPQIYQGTLNQFEKFFEAMIENGDLDLPLSRVEGLTLNVVLILRFHLEFLREVSQGAASGSGAVHMGLLQQLTLYEDKMPQASADQLREYLLPDMPAAEVEADARKTA